MNPALCELWALSQIDARIRDLEHQLAAVDSGAQAKRIRDLARARSEEADANLRRIESEMSDVDLNMKSAEARIKDIEGRMYSGKITNPKELDSFTKDVEMLKRNRDRLETRELELMDEQEAASEAAAKAHALLARKQKELDGIEASGAADTQRLSAELESARAERADQAQKAGEASESFLKRYESLLPKLGGVAMSLVEDQRCSACKVQVSRHLPAEIVNGDAIVVCESCARILYVER